MILINLFCDADSSLEDNHTYSTAVKHIVNEKNSYSFVKKTNGNLEKLENQLL